MAKIDAIVKLLDKHYPASKTSLTFRTPIQMLVSTILSAQTTDVKVNQVTRHLFKKYKTVKDYANADLREFQQAIKPVNFYQNKAKYIINSAKKIVQDFNGKVPKTMEELVSLPGVARKTANVVLGNAFGKVEGIVVDTHVKRVSYRLGLTSHTDPKKIEKDLTELLPKKRWISISYQLIDHGRALCKAPVPICSKCFLNKICPRKGVTKSK
jgi:endonuclease-3